jgi:hypothetical protein
MQAKTEGHKNRLQILRRWRIIYSPNFGVLGPVTELPKIPGFGRLLNTSPFAGTDTVAVQSILLDERIGLKPAIVNR